MQKHRSTCLWLVAKVRLRPNAHNDAATQSIAISPRQCVASVKICHLKQRLPGLILGINNATTITIQSHPLNTMCTTVPDTRLQSGLPTCSPMPWLLIAKSPTPGRWVNGGMVKHDSAGKSVRQCGCCREARGWRMLKCSQNPPPW